MLVRAFYSCRVSKLDVIYRKDVYKIQKRLYKPPSNPYAFPNFKKMTLNPRVIKEEYWETIPVYVLGVFSIGLIVVHFVWALRHKVDLVLSTHNRNTISRTMDLRNPTVNKMMTVNQKYLPWPEMQDVLDKMRRAEFPCPNHDMVAEPEPSVKPTKLSLIDDIVKEIEGVEHEMETELKNIDDSLEKQIEAIELQIKEALENVDLEMEPPSVREEKTKTVTVETKTRSFKSFFGSAFSSRTSESIVEERDDSPDKSEIVNLDIKIVEENNEEPRSEERSEIRDCESATNTSMGIIRSTLTTLGSFFGKIFGGRSDTALQNKLKNISDSHVTKFDVPKCEDLENLPCNQRKRSNIEDTVRVADQQYPRCPESDQQYPSCPESDQQ